LSSGLVMVTEIDLVVDDQVSETWILNENVILSHVSEVGSLD
jgi:hypothetical protein